KGKTFEAARTKIRTGESSEGSWNTSGDPRRRDMNQAVDRKRWNVMVVAVHKAVVAKFDESDWRALGFQTDTLEWIEGHDRLLRSLHWSDNDYAGHALSAITEMLKLDRANLQIMLDYS